MIGLVLLVAASCGEAEERGVEETSASTLTVWTGKGLLSDEGTVATIEILDGEGDMIDYGAVATSLFDSRMLYDGDLPRTARAMRVTFYPCEGECPPGEAWREPGSAGDAFGPGGRSTCTTRVEATEYTVRASLASEECEFTAH